MLFIAKYDGTDTLLFQFILKYLYLSALRIMLPSDPSSANTLTFP